MTLDEYLADLAAKAEKATPGPWKPGRADMRSYRIDGTEFARVYHATRSDGEHLGQPLPLTIGEAFNDDCKANAAHIAAFSPDVAAALVAVAEAAQELVCDVEGQIGDPHTLRHAKDALDRLTALARTR